MVMAALILAVCIPAFAQQDEAKAGRTAFSRRVMASFDFEDAPLDPGGVPRLWVRAQHDSRVPRIRPGFPIWNLAMLDDKVAHTGEGSVRLPTRGGSTSLLLDPGTIPTFAQADYRVSVYVRTAGLKYARASLIVQVLDSSAEPISGFRFQSKQVRTQGHWVELAVQIPGGDTQAAYLQVDLVLLQPIAQDFAVAHEPHRVMLEDVSGAAWFDDLQIVLEPRVELTTGEPGEVVLYPQLPKFDVKVHDMSGRPMDIRLSVIDAGGLEVATHQVSRTRSRGSLSWKPELKKFGWYEARLTLMDKGQVVGGTQTPFVWLNDSSQDAEKSDPGTTTDTDSELSLRPQSQDERRLEAIITELHPELNPAVDKLLAHSRIGAVTIPIWDQSLDQSQVAERIRQIQQVSRALVDAWRDVTFVLGRLPADLAYKANADPRDPGSVFLSADELWKPYLYDIIDRFGQRVVRWRLGQIEDVIDPAGIDAKVQAVSSALAPLVPGPLVSVSMSDEQLLNAQSIPESIKGMSVLMQKDAPAEKITQILNQWNQLNAARSEPADLVVALHASRDSGVPAKLVQQMVLFWKALGSELESRPADRVELLPRLGLIDPWYWKGEKHPRLVPTPAVGAWRATIDRLADRRVVAELAIAPGVRAFVLGPVPWVSSDRGGVIVAWNESALPEDAVLRAFMGSDPIRVLDLFGNEMPVKLVDTAALVLAGIEPPLRSTSNESPSLEIPIPAEPIFIEGIDVALMKFMASLSVSPSFIQKTDELHQIQLVMDNPWPAALDGEVYIAAPGGFKPDGTRDRSWSFRPRLMSVQIEPGDSLSIPIEMVVALAAESGPQMMVLDADIQTDRFYKDVRLRTRFEVGLDYLDVSVTPQVGPGKDGPDVVLDVRVTNKGNQVVTLQIHASAPGLPRSKASIGELVPGATVVRKLRFPGGADIMRHRRVMVSVTDIDINGRVNTAVVIP